MGKPESAKQPPQQEQPPQLSVDEQVSLMLAHFNRASNQASKEAESALVKVVAQLMEGRKACAYDSFRMSVSCTIGL